MKRTYTLSNWCKKRLHRYVEVGFYLIAGARICTACNSAYQKARREAK